MSSLASRIGVGNSAAGAINEQGQIVGEKGFEFTERRAFVLSPTGAARFIEPLDPAGWTSAADINDLGQVIGASYASTAKVRAFIWDEATGITELGVLRDSDQMVYASAINNSGQVVGRSGVALYLWHRETGMRDLHSMIIDQPTGAFSFLAADINDQGAISGNYGGLTQRAFVLVPIPEPTTISLAGIASLLILALFIRARW
jgi:probable HAF family extracellular repeat protein